MKSIPELQSLPFVSHRNLRSLLSRVGLKPVSCVNGRRYYDANEFENWYKEYKDSVKENFAQKLRAVARSKNHTNGVIYGILDPRDTSCRYVGQTINFEDREWEHMTYLRKGRHPNVHLQRAWDKAAHETGQEMAVVVLERVVNGDLNAREKHWIAELKEQGNKLCNATDGGETPAHNEETRRKISEAVKAKYKDPQYVKRLSESCGWFKKKELTQEEIDRKKKHQENMLRCALIRKQEEEKKKVFSTLTLLTCKGKVFVPLTQGKHAVADAAFMDVLKSHRWYTNKHGSKYRAKMTDRSKKLMSAVLRDYAISNRMTNDAIYHIV